MTAFREDDGRRDVIKWRRSIGMMRVDNRDMAVDVTGNKSWGNALSSYNGGIYGIVVIDAAAMPSHNHGITPV